MRSVPQKRIISLVSLTCAVMLSGCMYSPYGGGYGGGYGGYTQPGVYPQYGAPQYGTPIQTLTPGQQYVPGQTFPQGGGFPGTINQGGQPTYNNGSGGLQPIPDSSNAPTFESGNVKTPDPYFPSASTSSSLSPVNDGVQPVTHSEPSQLQPIGEIQEFRSQAPMNNAFAEPEATPTYGEASGLEFQPPVQNSNPFEPQAAAEPQAAPDQAMPVFNFEKVTPDQLDPFGHDPNYKWVRGVVSQDQKDGSWSIVFNDNPPETDQLAGHITLAQSPYLEQLEEGSVVEIQGEVDSIAKDPLGKPVYLIRSVTQLTKSPAQ